MQKTMTRDLTIDLLRGGTMICMVLGHSFIKYPVDISNVPWCMAIGHVIYTFHMELLFILSGWVCRYQGRYRDFIWKKFTRVLVPYITFGVATLLIKAVGGSLINGTVSIQEGIKKFLLYGGNYWFLYVLFLVYLIFPAIQKMCSTAGRKAILLAAVLFTDQFLAVPDLFAMDTMVHYLPYFLLGCIIKDVMTQQMRRRMERHWLLGAVLAGVLYLAIDGLLGFSSAKVAPIIDYIRALMLCTALFFLVERFGTDIKNSFAYGFFMDCSQYSLQIYLFNGWLLTLIRTIVCTVLGITSPVVIVLAIWIGDLAITWVACKIILPKIKFAKVLCGI